ncbi:MAG: ABC transporter substrate-binding protein [Candidatus Hodarchaeales archaeon]|jgi:ABC-type transport system substrate-binding protein
MLGTRIYSRFLVTIKIIFIIILTVSIVGYVKPVIIENNTKTTNSSPEPIFKVHMLVPTNNPIRAHYAELIAKELETIGISTDIYFDSAGSPWFWRSYGDEVGQWSDGGYDISFIGELHSTDLLPGLLWVNDDMGITTQFGRGIGWSPELGKNYYNYRAAESESLLQSLRSTWNRTEYKQLMYDWQKVLYDALPAIPIIDQDSKIFLVSNGLYGFDFGFTPFQNMETVWNDSSFTGTQDQVVIATDAALDPFNLLLDSSIALDHITPVMDSLLGVTPTKDLILPDGTNRESWMTTQYGTSEYLELYPRIATSFGNFSSNGLEYNITVRDDVYWHDGHQLDAWDVVFSYQARLLQEITYQEIDNLRDLFGKNNKTESHGVYSIDAFDTDDNGFFETVNFNFENNRTTYLFESAMLLLQLFPEHILGDPSDHGYNATNDFDPHKKWLSPPIEWENHSYNTGNPTDPGGLNGPIGCGSMVFDIFDTENSTVYLKKFEDIQWDNVSKNWIVNSTNDHYRIKTGKLDQMPDSVLIKSMDFLSSVEEINTSKVNIIDFNSFNNEFGWGDRPLQEIFNCFNNLQTETQFKVIKTQLAYAGWQYWMKINPKSTFSTELSSSDRPFSKKGVHHAISHMVPRQLIVDELTGGMAYLNMIPPMTTTAWGYLSDADLLAYKKTLVATDGSFPEADATTGIDSYNRQVALDWLASEGYDVSEWRSWNFTKPAWVTNEPQQWYKSIKADTTIEFKINSLRNENNTPSWYWEAADVTLHEGDTISITWLEDPDIQQKFEYKPDQKIEYPISVSIGGTVLDENHSKQFGWFILPLVTTNHFGEHESGIYSVQRHFSQSFPLFNLGTDFWDMDVENDPRLHEIGGSAIIGDEINAYIATGGHWFKREERVFNVTYQANTGILKSLLFTNIEGKDASIGIDNSYIVSGLNQLEISKVEPEPTSTTTTTTTTTSHTTTTTPTASKATYIPMVMVVTILSILSLLRKRRRN